MEGLMSETELTETLTKFMKGASAPGVDGFTVNWLREFWPDLRKLVTNALNEMYGEGILSSMCREAIIRLLRKGEKNHFFLVIIDQYPFYPSSISWHQLL